MLRSLLIVAPVVVAVVVPVVVIERKTSVVKDSCSDSSIRSHRNSGVIRFPALFA